MSDFKPKLKDLENELTPIATKWREIGIQLDLTPEELEIINVEEKDSIRRKLISMLTKWLKQVIPQPSWKGLVVALSSQAVDEEGLATKLEQKYNQLPLSSAKGMTLL